jgi:hypothetical protein
MSHCEAIEEITERSLCILLQPLVYDKLAFTVFIGKFPLSIQNG